MPGHRRYGMRLVLTCLFPFLFGLLFQTLNPTSALAYHHFYIRSGASFLVVKWRTFPVNLVVDNGPTNILADVQTAVATWNNIVTAQNVLGTVNQGKLDYTLDNFETAWGIQGDGVREVVVDEDGSIIRFLTGRDANGVAVTLKEVIGGEGVITDGFVVINASRTDFDRLSTAVHELGHFQGLAHSSVGMHNSDSFASDALDPINVNSVPTMHPFSIGTSTGRRTPEADDIASLSELYPEGGFPSGSSIEGTVTKCFSDDAVIGINVRAVNTSNPNIQISRFSGFDGNSQGRYIVRFLPAGNYRLIVEPMGANDFTLNRFGNPPVKAEVNFATEYYNPPEEESCSEEIPDTAVNIAVSAASAASSKNVKVGGADLAFVVDDTGSMSNEIGAVRTGLSHFISIMDDLNRVLGIPFPSVAIVTFKDDVTKRLVSDKPDRLQAMVNGLFASGGGDCPESSNAALLTAGRLLKTGGTIRGVSLLFTDADSRPDGPTREEVASLYRSKGASVFTLLSASCSGSISSPSTLDVPQSLGANSSNSSGNLDEFDPPPTLGFESSVRTFSEISLETGGFFTAIPGIRFGDPEETQRYINTVTNLAVSSVVPAIGLVTPGDVPRGATLNVEVAGSNTNFQASSMVTFSGDGITLNSLTVVSPERIQANVSISQGATLGFRDIVVTTNLGGSTTEEAKGLGAFQVVTSPVGSTITGVIPSQGAQGRTLTVAISGTNTNFLNGVSVANFGPGVAVNSTTVFNSTSASCNISIDGIASIGFRDVRVTTNSEVATESVVGPFFVTAPPPLIPRIAVVSPAQGFRGQPLEVTITGENTTFGDGSIVTFSGSGITVNGVAVISSTVVRANLSIAGDAPLGFRDVSVATGDESSTALRAFQVTEIPFDLCLQDDSNGHKLQINSTSGAYLWTNCSGVALTGTGILTVKGSVVTLQHNPSDRRLLARIDRSVRKATASMQVFSVGSVFSIMDRNTNNNNCVCLH